MGESHSFWANSLSKRVNGRTQSASYSDCRAVPDHEKTLLPLVRCLTSQRRNRDALRLAEAGVALAPSSAAAQAALSLARREMGDRQGAEEALDLAKQLDADDPSVAWAGTHADKPSAQ